MTAVEQILHFTQECFKMKRLFSAMFHVGAGCPKPFSGHSRWESYFLRWQPPRADFRLPGLPPDPHHTPQTTPAHGRIPYRYHITKVWAVRVYLCVCLVQARSLWLPQALNQALRCQCTCVGYVRSKQWARFIPVGKLNSAHHAGAPTAREQWVAPARWVSPIVRSPL